jgi:hypothetical protein
MKADELLISAEELPWREFDFLADHGSMSDLAILRHLTILERAGELRFLGQRKVRIL